MDDADALFWHEFDISTVMNGYADFEDLILEEEYDYE